MLRITIENYNINSIQKANQIGSIQVAILPNMSQYD